VCIGLRYFNVFGRRQDPNVAYAAVIPKWIGSLLRGEPCLAYGDGETSRDFCYVDNVLQANVLAATLGRDGTPDKVYNVACGERISLNDLYIAIRDGLAEYRPEVARASLIYEDFRPGDVRHSEADIEKLREWSGYQPTHTWRDGLREALPWYVEDYARRSETVLAPAQDVGASAIDAEGIPETVGALSAQLAETMGGLAAAAAKSEEIVNAVVAGSDPVEVVQSPVQEVAAIAGAGTDELAMTAGAGVESIAEVGEATSDANEIFLISDVYSGGDPPALGGHESLQAFSAGIGSSLVSQASDAGTGTIQSVVDPVPSVVAPTQAVPPAGETVQGVTDGVAAASTPVAETVQSPVQGAAATASADNDPRVKASIYWNAGTSAEKPLMIPNRNRPE
jgi:hypothetical protein